jgi:hypothetical protein
MNEYALQQVNRVRQQVVDAASKGHKPTTWPGPYRTPRPTQPKRCVGCGTTLSPQLRRVGAWWCEPCKDPHGYLQRLEKANAEARDRCRTAYPPADIAQGELFAE